MKLHRPATLLLLICTVSASQADQSPPEQKCDENVLVTGFTGIPKDAASVADRLASCNHFWGEYGDDPDRNAEVNKSLKELRCNTVEADAAAINAKYAKNRSVLHAMSCAAQL